MASPHRRLIQRARELNRSDCSVIELREHIREIFWLIWCVCGWYREGIQERRERLMTRILFLGYDPETVDFSDPALPPGMTVEKVHA